MVLGLYDKLLINWVSLKEGNLPSKMKNPFEISLAEQEHAFSIIKTRLYNLKEPTKTNGPNE